MVGQERKTVAWQMSPEDRAANLRANVRRQRELAEHVAHVREQARRWREHTGYTRKRNGMWVTMDLNRWDALDRKETE